MPHIAQRDEENNTRKKRQAQLARGPGVFVYDGSLEDTESIPTPLLTGAKEVLLDSEGMPVSDSSGRVVHKPAGRVVTDIHGRAVMGGKPKVKRKKRETVVIRGIEFRAGEAVYVADGSIALKLRGMPGFDELPSDQIEDDAPKSRPAAIRAAELAGKPAPLRRSKKKDAAEAAPEAEPESAESK